MTNPRPICPIHNAKNPKRTQAQRDAAWLRYLTMLLAFKPSEYKRLKQIANRLEKQQ